MLHGLIREVSSFHEPPVDAPVKPPPALEVPVGAAADAAALLFLSGSLPDPEPVADPLPAEPPRTQPHMETLRDILRHYEPGLKSVRNKYLYMRLGPAGAQSYAPGAYMHSRLGAAHPLLRLEKRTLKTATPRILLEDDLIDAFRRLQARVHRYHEALKAKEAAGGAGASAVGLSSETAEAEQEDDFPARDRLFAVLNDCTLVSEPRPVPYPRDAGAIRIKLPGVAPPLAAPQPVEVPAPQPGEVPCGYHFPEYPLPFLAPSNDTGGSWDLPNFPRLINGGRQLHANHVAHGFKCTLHKYPYEKELLIRMKQVTEKRICAPASYSHTLPVPLTPRTPFTHAASHLTYLALSSPLCDSPLCTRPWPELRVLEA